MLRIHLFGQLRLTQDEQPWRFAAPPRTLPLWAYLLLRREAPLSRNRLAFTFWPDATEAGARASLRRHLHELRRALPPAPAGRPWLLAEGEEVQWNPAGDYWLDVAAFERLSLDPGTLAEALRLAEADLLPDLYEDWLIVERERLRNAWLAGAARLAAQSRARGDLDGALHYTRLILQRDPLREEAVRDLIALRREAGDRAGALLEYRRFEERLREELGVAPLPETTELYERLKAEGGRAAEPARPAHARQPPLPHNLPAQLTSFLGRAEELDAIQGLLAPPQAASDQGARLLTLTGPGGAGKTRLALEAAARLARPAPAPFPDGVCFVPLSDVGSPDFVAAAIAQRLGVSETAGQPLEQGLQEHLRGRQMLLVLDNFEHVAEAAPLVGRLLGAAPGLRALVTSRVALQLYGEHDFPVEPLPLPDLRRLPPPAGLLAYPAAALFVERLRAARRDFELTEENAPAVAEICVRLDGLPLALELAAARGKLYSPQMMLARLAGRLKFLESGPRARGAAARQQTLRQTIDWSYHLLSEEEQRLFCRLGVFAGAFTADAAEAAAGESAAPPQSLLELLEALVNQSMLRPEPEAGPDGEPRFRLLFTLREYALERLAAAGELEATRARHARYYLGLAERTAPGLTGRRQDFHLAQLLSAQDNLRAALEWCRNTPDLAETGLRLARALGDFWYRRSEFAEGRRWLQGALEAWPDAPGPLRAAALHHLGVLARDLSDYPAAWAALEEAETLWRGLGEAGERGLAWTLRSLGMLAFHQEDLDRAERYQSASLGLQRRLGDGRGIAAALNSLGVIAYSRVRYAEALARFEESLPLARAAEDRQLVGDVLSNMGMVTQAQGRYAEARARMTEALAEYRALGDQYGQAIALNNLSNAARPQGDLAAARAYAAESVALYREVGNRAKLGRPLFHLGAAALLQEDFETAEASLTESLEIHLEHRFLDGAVEAIQGFAWLALAQGEAEPAARLLAAAWALREAGGTPLHTVSARAERERIRAAIEAALPPATFALAWEAGRALSLDEAAALALGRSPPQKSLDFP